ncbi:GNAT family N-acetyltransferase [Lamprobacter modestohalophilus]|uniref:GNAT family N-acetyltransferase n=1 Tax=Lamprobacter modestohalophilus TaxID=1064514 RepID=UPI0019049AE9|nr:GNAT family N-acetyltransferase [Lamprobacter modestohalophilus]
MRTASSGVDIRPWQAGDEAQWDAFVDQHGAATPYHASAWLKSVEHAYRHPNQSLLAFQRDSVVGVAPACQFNRPLGKPTLCCQPFCDTGHILSADQKIHDALKNALADQARTIGATQLTYRASDTDPTDQPPAPGAKVQMRLALPDDPATLLASFKSKLRSQIRKAEKNGLTVSTATDDAHLDAFYRIMAVNMRKLGSPVHSRQWFASVRNHYCQRCAITIVWHGTVPIGAGLVLRSRSLISIPWASTLASHNPLAPNMLLYWTILAQACQEEAGSFDFGRSTVDEGTYKFKQQWGAKPVNLYCYHGHPDAFAPVLWQQEEAITSVRAWVIDAWSKLPLPLTNWAGPRIRKYISL